MQTGVLIDRLAREVERFRELEEKLSDPAIASNPSLLKQFSSEHSRMTPRVRRIEEYLGMLRQLEESRQILSDPSADPELKEMAREEAHELEERLETEERQIQTLLIPPDPNAGKDLILEIRAGTGGEEAGLFVGDLYRMYIRFCERRELALEQISSTETEMGGYKEVIFSVSGASAYSLLHREGGAHRVQRIPVTESGGRIHTSAVTVAVMPEAKEEEVEIREQDLRVDVYRASGAGGQHVNKTESAVRMLHIPTGIVVTCQDERSQIKNRAKALRVLRARIAEKQEEERHAESSAMKKEQVGSGDRSERIRTYNFPQGRVTDHRINFTAYNLGAFMEGEMDDLLDALIQDEIEQKLKEMA